MARDRGAGRLGELEFCGLVQRLGAFVRFRTSIPLNEMAIIMAGRKWTAPYELSVHRRLAVERD